MTTRRTLLLALGTGALATQLASLAPAQGKVWRVGFVWENEQSVYLQWIDAFRAGMRELGYVERRDYVMEHRSARSDVTRLPALAAELLALKVDVIIPSGTPSAVAVHKVTREIPILIVIVGDPVGSGLAATLRRPGGNVTGLSNQTTELYTKQLDLLRQILPGMRRAGFLYNPDNSNDALGLRHFESDCGKLQFTSVRAPVRKPEEITDAFNILKRERVQGLIVSASNSNSAWREGIIEQAAKHRLAAVYGRRFYAESGGLISYGTDAEDLYRRVAAYADKIFKGAKPGDLPIEQANKFELVINLRTAKALALTIPQTLRISADKVIE